MSKESQRIGDALYKVRKEKRISQDMLCLGLCTKGAFSKFEWGERRPDRLLLNTVLLRLGKNPDKMATILTAEEYAYFVWKKKVLTAVGQQDMSALKRLLEEPEAERIVVHEGLQRQFLYQMEAVVVEYEDQDPEKCIRLLTQAVELTMPGIRQNGAEQYLISVDEMRLLLHLARYLIRGEQKDEALRMLLNIVAYIEKHYEDYEAKVKVYPMGVKLLVPLLLEQKRELEGAVLCKKAVELLCWQGVLYDLAELMELFLACSEGLPRTEEIARYEKQLWALKEVYREFGGDGYLKENYLLSYSNQEVYLIDEVIKRSRAYKELSQEALSEGICTPETLSRIERGERGPNTRNFRALMKKLDTGLDYYNGELDTDDFLVLEQELELERAISLKNWEEAQRLLEDLKLKVDMSSPKNQQTLQAKENCILFNQKKLGLQEFLKSCEQAMNCEGEKWREERFWKQFFTKYKVNTMNYMACIYHIDHRMEDALFILEHLLKCLMDSKIGLAGRYRSSMTVIQNLSSFYGEAGKLKECLEMCEVGIRLCMECGRGAKLGVFLGNKAEAMNIEAGKALEVSKSYLKWTFYISDLLSNHSVAAYTDKYYRENYEPDIIWY